jgi:hypothetical protein
MHEYTYFWITENNVTFGPYFESEEAANLWLKERIDNDQSTKDE